jgi:hypothetical protein
MPNNRFTTKIFDVITPPGEELSSIFIVMEHVQTDLKKIF